MIIRVTRNFAIAGMATASIFLVVHGTYASRKHSFERHGLQQVPTPSHAMTPFCSTISEPTLSSAPQTTTTRPPTTTIESPPSLSSLSLPTSVHIENQTQHEPPVAKRLTSIPSPADAVAAELQALGHPLIPLERAPRDDGAPAIDQAASEHQPRRSNPRLAGAVYLNTAPDPGPVPPQTQKTWTPKSSG